MTRLGGLFLFAMALILPKAAYAWEKLDELQMLQNKNKVSLVFASENIRSPISSFGHTFIVFHNQTPPEMSAIALEFVGDSTKPEFSYLKAGIAKVPGKYQLMPYYQKVRQYDLEDRDLWVFPVNDKGNGKTIEQLKTSVLSKLNKAYPYNFFTNNCSYYVAAFLLDELEIQQHLGGQITIPAQSVKYLLRHQVLGEGVYIKSQQKAMIEAYRELPPADRKIIREFIKNPEVESPQNVDAALASAALTYQFKREHNGYVRDVVYRQKKTYNDSLSRTLEPKEFSPTSGQLSAQATDDGAVIVQFMPAQNNLKSYLPQLASTNHMTVASMSFYVKNTFRLQSLNLLKIDAATPSTPFSSGFTRYLDVSYYDWKPLVNEEASEYVFRYGAGVTKAIDGAALSVVPFVGLKYNHQAHDDDTLVEAGIKNKLSLQAFGGKLDLQHMWLANGGRAYKNKFKAEAVRPITKRAAAYLNFDATPHNTFVSGGFVFNF